MSENPVAVTQADRDAALELQRLGPKSMFPDELARFLAAHRLAQSPAAGLEREADGAPGGCPVGELESYEKFDGVGPHAETIETRARIGERYLECYESALSDPQLAGYTPADCPSELLLDLLERYRETTKPTPPASVSGEGRPYPDLLSLDEQKAILARAEQLWSDLQANNLGGFSGNNRPFWIVAEFKGVIEAFGRRDVGLHWTKDQLLAAAPEAATDIAEHLTVANATPCAVGGVDRMREAAQLAYRICAETRHVTLGDKVRAAILALASGETSPERGRGE